MTRRAAHGLWPADDYHWRGGSHVTIGATPIALVPVASGRITVPPPAASGAGGGFEQDSALEQERAILGGFILAEVDEGKADSAIRNAHHRRILDALAGEYVGSVEVAIQLCRAAGLPPELVGRVDGRTALGYLAGCVRSWRGMPIEESTVA